MKHLQLFESFLNHTIFIRMNHQDLLRDKESITMKKTGTSVGIQELCDVLYNRGYPDLRNCIHFSRKESYNPGMGDIWGKNLYQIKIEEDSQIGWTFFLNINDWFYKSNPYNYQKRNNQEFEKLVKRIGFDDIRFIENDVDILERMVEILEKEQLIGHGTISDLIKTKWWNTDFKMFGWSSDEVEVVRWNR